MITYYKHKLHNTIYRTRTETTRLEMQVGGNDRWMTTMRDILQPKTMEPLVEIDKPQSWLFATVTITLTLLLLAYTLGGA